MEVRDIESLRKLNDSLENPYPFLACTTFKNNSQEKLPDQQLAAMSRVKLSRTWQSNFSLMQPSINEIPRGILALQLFLPNKKQITIYLVHLKSNRDSAKAAMPIREQSIDFILDDLSNHNLNPHKHKILICGDYNTSLKDPRFRDEESIRRLLKSGFFLTNIGLSESQKSTLLGNNRYPPATFDHILASKPLLEFFPGNSPWSRPVPISHNASDHFPLTLSLFGKNYIFPINYRKYQIEQVDLTKAPTIDRTDLDGFLRNKGKLVRTNVHIFKVFQPKSKPVKILNCAKYWKEAVCISISVNDKHKWIGQNIEVTGFVEEYKGHPQILVTDLDRQVKVME